MIKAMVVLILAASVGACATYTQPRESEQIRQLTAQQAQLSVENMGLQIKLAVDEAIRPILEQITTLRANQRILMDFSHAPGDKPIPAANTRLRTQ